MTTRYDPISGSSKIEGAEKATIKDKLSQAIHTTVDKTKELTGMGSTSGSKTSDLGPSVATTHPGSVTTLPTGNRGVVFGGAGNIEVRDVPWPKMELPWNGTPCKTGCIVKVLLSGICGSDLHPFRRRTGMSSGVVLGHEFLGEVVEVGPGVEFTKVGDWGVTPFNVACGTCVTCKQGRTDTCEVANPQREQFGQGGLYGYVCGGGWQGGQAQYAFIPWCDYNFVKFENKALARAKLLDLVLLSDVLPTAFHGTEEACVQFGSTVFIAGAGPIGLTAAALCNLKGASHVIIADPHPERLELARRLGCFTINLSEIKDHSTLGEYIEGFTGKKFVDCGIDCVGYEAKALGTRGGKNVPTTALDMCIEAVKPAGHIGVLGVYVMGDPKGTPSEMKGYQTFNFGKSWMKSQHIQGGQATCMKYLNRLQNMIFADKLPISKILNCRVISLDDAPSAYKHFSDGIPHKFVIDPHNTLGLLATSGSTTVTGTTTTTGTGTTLPMDTTTV